MTNIDLEGADADVLRALQGNKRVLVTGGRGTPLTLRYQSPYNISSRHELKFKIEKAIGGIKRKEVDRSYPGIDEDITEMIRSGEIIAVKSQEKNTEVLFPRGERFLTRLPGRVIAPIGEEIIETTEPLHTSIRRGDAIQVGTQWFRVSSMIRQNGTQPARAQAPKSVTSIKDLSERNEYILTFDDVGLPLDREFDGEEEYQGVAYKHGCTNDIRGMWAETAALVPSDENELQQKLLSVRLISRAAQKIARPVVRGGEKDKRKKPRKQKQREVHYTNLHLQGTDQWNAVMSNKDA